MNLYRRVGCRLLLIMVVLLILPFGCGQPARFGIVFASNRDGNFEIYRMTSDGKNVERLTYTPDYDEQVVKVSPDGSKIIFDRGGSRLDRDIYLLDIPSGAISQLTNTPGYDFAGAWSPDGGRIAFMSDREKGDYRLYTMNVDGSDQQHIPLVTDPECDVTGTSWSPDDHHMVYGTSGHIQHMTGITAALFVVDLVTGEVKQVLNEERLGGCFEPDWSPNGEWIAMVCTRGVPADDYGEVCIVRPDGSDLRQVTERPADYRPGYTVYTTWTWVREPHWSPDGEQIVYAAVDSGHWNIHIIGADGKDDRRLTDHNATDWWLSVYRLP